MSKTELAGDIDLYQRPFNIGDVFSYTDEPRQGKRIGLVRQAADSTSQSVLIFSLSKNLGDDCWLPDGREKDIPRSDIICVHYPKILGKENLVSLI